MKFSEQVMAHFFAPRNVGSLEPPCGEATAGSVRRGAYIRMYARVDRGRVRDARWLTYGCVPAIAAGSALTEWAIGRDVREVMEYSSAQLIEALGGLPPRRVFCAELAVEALRNAVRSALEGGGE
jgi:nitrogen fixation NifU-like protein